MLGCNRRGGGEKEEWGKGKNNTYVVGNGEEGLEQTKRANCIWGGERGKGIDVEGELSLSHTFAYTLPHTTDQTASKMSSKSAKIHNMLRV